MTDRAATIDRVRALLASHDSQSGSNQGWDDAWKEGMTPWDSGEPQEALVSVWELEDVAPFLPKAGHALVSGCGRGYDPLFFAQQGFEAKGIDISEEAVKQAKKWLESQPASEARDRVSFEKQDFFKYEPSSGPVDLAYDYTFLCALPPSLRPQWAETYARIIKPGGILFAVVYPIKGPNAGPEGPPFNVAPQHYKDLLSDNFEIVWEGKPPRQKDTHVGVEEVQIWRRRA
ncbi:hypothetical protein OC846_004706 [Tilletia horrida]|uniref:S-adenosyl-L-methionine-dependent methyltransferase n=1 Tax=Tilletia horrida TaxID=155126 RepID=A0AAN6GM82_9BASI|nr:hypothetical protein OC846_004706 [Tilletia horrida]